MEDETSIRLELIAAKARQLAEDYKNNRLWPGQLEQGLSELYQQISLIKRG